GRSKGKGAIEGRAAVVNGLVYVGAVDDHLYALDLATGQEKWKYKGAFKAPPSVRDGVVYVGDMDGFFHSIDAATGQKRCSFETMGEISGGGKLCRGPVLVGSGYERLCVPSWERQKLWTFKVAGGPVLGTPAVVNGRTFAAGCDRTLHVLDTSSGKELASTDLGGEVGATPAVVGEHLYLGTMTNQLLAVAWKK